MTSLNHANLLDTDNHLIYYLFVYIWYKMFVDFEPTHKSMSVTEIWEYTYPTGLTTNNP